jgi:hypothetical protein
VCRADHSSRGVLPTELGVSECDREASTTKRLRSTGDVATLQKLFPSFYINVIGLLEINNRPESGNAYYHSVQNLLSPSSIYNNLKIKVYRTIILPVVLYGCET